MKPFHFITTLSLFLCSSITAQVPDSVKFKSLLPYDFHMTYLKEDKAILIDVRELYEFRGKRIREAVNIPLSGNLEFSADTIEKDCALLIYCLIGDRSEVAAEYFCGKGFTRVYSLEGGIVAWRKERMPVIKKRLPAKSRRHRTQKD